MQKGEDRQEWSKMYRAVSIGEIIKYSQVCFNVLFFYFFNPWEVELELGWVVCVCVGRGLPVFL